MANNDLVDKLQEKAGIEDREGLRQVLDRVMTEPEQANLLEAMAADGIDAFPIVGDALMLSRKKRAEEMGMDYPQRPAVVENTLSDIPAPLDTVGDILIAQNTMSYLENQKGIPVATAFEEAAEDVGTQMDELVGDGIDRID